MRLTVYEKVFADTGDSTHDTFIAVAVGGVDVDGVFNVEGARCQFEVFKSVGQYFGYHGGPTVNDGLVKEFFFEGKAFRCREPAVDVVKVREVFFVAREAEEGSREGVEGEGRGLAVDGEESRGVLKGEWFRGLFLDGGFEKEVARAEERGIADFLGAIGYFWAVVRIEEVDIHSDLEIDMQEVLEYGVEGVTQTVGQTRDVDKKHER